MKWKYYRHMEATNHTKFIGSNPQEVQMHMGHPQCLVSSGSSHPYRLEPLFRYVVAILCPFACFPTTKLSIYYITRSMHVFWYLQFLFQLRTYCFDFSWKVIWRRAVVWVFLNFHEQRIAETQKIKKIATATFGCCQTKVHGSCSSI